jgi:hypothetical protein
MTWTARITSIRALDQVPQRPPDQRNVDGRGYVRLRWKIGIGHYLECYEHRLVAGFPDAHVHHVNESKGDNGMSNLQPLSPGEHTREHNLVIDGALVVALYRTGMSTQRIARSIGHDPSAVWRSLKRSGEPTRNHTEAAVWQRRK